MRRFIPNTPDKISMPIVLGGAAILAVIIGLIVMSSKSGSSADPRKLEERLARMESRIIVLEEKNHTYSDQHQKLQDAFAAVTENIQKIQAMPMDMEGLQKKVEFLHSRQANLEKTLASATGRTVKPQEPVPSPSKPIATEPKPKAAEPVKAAAVGSEKIKTPQVSKKSASRAGKPKYHEVRQDETIYSIARRYDTTVNALLRLNNISKNEIIQPGRRILITP